MNLRATAVVTLFFLSCGPTDTEPPCSSSTCGGCCDFSSSFAGVCVTSTTASSCGTLGRECAACSAGQECVSGTCDYKADTLPAGALSAFVTSGVFTGNLGGIAGADQKCQAAAAGANLTGSWKAWISDVNDVPGSASRPTVNAIDRITATGPWYLLCRDSQKKLIKVFNNKAQLGSTPLDVLNCTELGAPPNDTIAGVWTGTATGGMAQNLRDTSGVAQSNCAGWTESGGSSVAKGVFGTLNTPATKWTSVGNYHCASQFRLYCFQN